MGMLLHQVEDVHTERALRDIERRLLALERAKQGTASAINPFGVAASGFGINFYWQQVEPSIPVDYTQTYSVWVKPVGARTRSEHYTVGLDAAGSPEWQRIGG